MTPCLKLPLKKKTKMGQGERKYKQTVTRVAGIERDKSKSGRRGWGEETGGEADMREEGQMKKQTEVAREDELVGEGKRVQAKVNRKKMQHTNGETERMREGQENHRTRKTVR